MTIIIFLCILGLLALIEMFWYRRHALDDLDLDVSFSKEVARHGEIVEVIEVAQNNKRLPLPFLLLKFEATPVLEFQDMTNTSVSDLQYRQDMLTMKPFSRHTRRIKAKCTRRGFYSFTRVNITTSDLLLTGKLTREFPADASITILPEIIFPRELNNLMSVTYSDMMTRRTLFTDPFSFAGIREYQPWDPMKSINWTASAKAGDFMVNVNTSTSARKVTIFLNLERYNPKKSISLLEKSISFAYSYICELAGTGVPVNIITNARDYLSHDTVAYSLSGSSTETDECGTKLARIDLDLDVLPFESLLQEELRYVGDDDFVVVISARYDQVFLNGLHALQKKCRSSAWVLPCYRGTMTEDKAVLPKECIKWEMAGHD